MTKKQNSPFDKRSESMGGGNPAGSAGTAGGNAPRGIDALERLRSQLPPGETKPAAAAPASEAPRTPRAVVRLERKQRRGKEVTVIEKLALPPKELERWCRELKQALGCGGSVEGDAIVLQGDLRQRVPAVLTARGVAKVTIG